MTVKQRIYEYLVQTNMLQKMQMSSMQGCFAIANKWKVKGD